MAITHEDFQKAKRISRAIQEYLELTKATDLRSTDVYPYLARKGLVEKDRHNGLHFRQFLIKLKDNNLLNLIPQCVCIPGLKNEFNEWHFYRIRNECTISKDTPLDEPNQAPVIAPIMTEDDTQKYITEHRRLVESLPQNNHRSLTPQEQDTRLDYPRAYEFWTDTEIEIMRDFYKMSRNIDSVAKLLDRQPSALQRKLKDLGLLPKSG